MYLIIEGMYLIIEGSLFSLGSCLGFPHPRQRAFLLFIIPIFSFKGKIKGLFIQKIIIDFR